PFTFDYANSKTYSPKLKLNPYSWTKVANIIFVDTPVGSGFSYAKTSEGYYISDTLAAAELYEFLRKWLKVHPKFLTNTLYVMGDSYSGIIIPILVQEISDGNEAGREPRMNLKGYVIGNPVTNTNSTKKDCKGEYMTVDPSNAACVDDLKVYTECIEKIVTQHILEPTCQLLYPKPRPRVSKWDPDTPIEDSAYLLQSITHLPEPRRWCREYNYLYSYIWANDKTVQKALHVREGSINEWVRCNESLVYTYDVTSSLNYHRNLIKKGYEVLIYRFTMQYTFKKYCLTFATGGGHTAPEYKPNECLAMIDRWLSFYPL
ncbi:serine carboxypeptidase-like 18, partial [Quercus suber]